MKLGFRNISSRCGHPSVQRAFGREEPRRVAEQRRYAATLDRSVKWNLRDEARDDQSQRISVKELPGNARQGAPDLPLDLTMAINKVLMSKWSSSHDFAFFQLGKSILLCRRIRTESPADWCIAIAGDISESENTIEGGRH